MAAATCPALPEHPLPLHVRFGVMDCLRDMRAKGGAGRNDTLLAAIQDRLYREDPAHVADAYHRALLGVLDLASEGAGRHGLLVERIRALHRPVPTRDRIGLGLAEMAKVAGLDRETLVCLLLHHGYLDLAPYGGRQRRSLVTDAAYCAELGHNVTVTGWRTCKAPVFPVFYPERVSDILWTLDFDGIRGCADSIPRKPDKLEWLLSVHGYLPVGQIARLSGYSRSGFEKALRRRPASSSSFNNSYAHSASTADLGVPQ